MNQLNPVVSVILPLYRAKHTAWLSLESLCRQKEIDFKWELVIAEEVGTDFHAFGLKTILKYRKRLKQAGCIKIKYYQLSQWIALSAKYYLLIQNCSENSKLCVIQQADYFSSPFRLSITYQKFLNGADWINGDTMILWNALKDENNILGKKSKSMKFWMAFRMDLARKIPKVWKWRTLDQFLWSSVSNLLDNKVNRSTFDLRDGLVVHGFNNISFKEDKRWKYYPFDLDEIIPEELAQRLKKQMKLSHKWKIKVPHRTKVPIENPEFKEFIYD
jgi:hypothetical protein